MKSNVPPGDDSPMILFRILSNFHCALEELMFPFPKGFHEDFVKLGFYCLPRNVFLQYLERQVFELTPSFVDQVMRDLGVSEEDTQFKNMLLVSLEELFS
eukprot:TRINITY_DN1771_c0_g1_i4.p1 TRINITY_DN1771_c0_g1~~TRINITY_DN1771_c0_g1_i4.p1  ORF type:complete len:100 (+),score=15.31 TRINITY_DN1771_c0_g1_i4:68-367(+)